MQFMEDLPIIVVGAGLSGLTAAWKLQQCGREVIVLEAANRIGGRAVRSRRQWEDGQYADLGGELIDSSYHALRALCSELDVELGAPHVYGEQRKDDESVMEAYLRVAGFVIGDKVLTRDECETIRNELRAAARAHRPHSGEIVEQWIRRAQLSDLAAGITRAVTRLLTQLDPWDCDVHYVFGPQDGTFQRIRGGTETLLAKLAGDLDVRLSDPVVQIERAREALVTTSSGQKIRASAVISAVGPFAVSAIGFDPPLSDERVMTATSLLPAMAGKVIGQYAEGDAVRQAFSSLVCTDSVINAAWVTAPESPGTSAIVTSFFAGAERGLMTDDEAALTALDALVEKVVGTSVNRVQGEVKNWWAEPLHLGVTVAPPEGMRATIAGILGAEELVTHFAGDYTDAPMSGTLEGAVRSGLRAAHELLRDPKTVHTDLVTERLSIS